MKTNKTTNTTNFNLKQENGMIKNKKKDIYRYWNHHIFSHHSQCIYIMTPLLIILALSQNINDFVLDIDY